MDATHPSNEHGSDKKDNPSAKDEVRITINGIVKVIHRGRHTVIDIKNLGGIPLADELEQLVDGVLTPLPDDASLTIKGGEVFVSHVKASGSSWE